MKSFALKAAQEVFFHYRKTAVWEHLKTHRNLYRDALHAENYEDASEFVAVSLD